ncbi:MAG: Spy/CpxP family protein refolding chaperone [Hyphomicrobiaceae bacterium]|jgi:Spy/CpxP family protein refolding chaperone
MIKNLTLTGIVACLATSFAVGAQASGKVGNAPYAGQQGRAIKSLSPEDIAALEAGRGWGFAKPAELNGYPGPLHVLELAKKLDLTAEQRGSVQAVFDEMKAAAQKAGQAFLTAERALDAAFAKGVATSDVIAELTLASAKARAEVQRVHLQAHLQTTPLLTKMQRHQYVTLRGYAGGRHGGHGNKGKGSHSGH